MGKTYKHDDIAIIGISGRFPEADTLSDFWNNLTSAKESVRELPMSRKEEIHSIMEDVYEKHFIKSGYLDQVSLFEPEIYALNHEESKYIDPQHRLLLELVEEAILDAGYNPEYLANTHMGVFIAGNVMNYTEKLCASSPMAFSNSVHSSNAGRIAYVYNFHGPVITMDTACSSSLVALHYACQSLQMGECAMALAGGAKIDLVPTFIDSKHYNPVASRNAQVRAFDKDAAGTVGGEGGGIILLKLLKDAIQDRDPVHAIIKGTAINSDGRWSNGMSAPSEKGQADVIVQAVENAEIDPLSISYIETHGTGTELGDPIEVAGIKRALEQFGYKKQSVPITSLKPNIGHLDVAAGIAGVIKTVLALKNKQLPPSINFSEPNPLIRFENTPVYVNNRLTDWESDSVRRAAVTSLGLIGTNCNIILEEAPVAEEDAEPLTHGPQIVELSARTTYSLGQNVQNLKVALSENPKLAFSDIVYTLNTGRRRFNKKFLFIAENTAELLEQLQGYSEEQICTHRSKDPEPAPIFILPDFYDLDLAEAGEIYQNQPVYREAFDQIKADLAKFGELDDERAEYLAHLYAYAELLKTYGLKPKAVLGFGMGDGVADLIRGEISLADTVQRIVKYKKQGKMEIPIDRLNQMVKKIAATGINTFALIWPDQELVEKFYLVLTDELIQANFNQGNGSLLRTILELMRQGLQVDWNQVYKSQPGKKINLPGYAFDRKSFILPVDGLKLQSGAKGYQKHPLYDEAKSDLLYNLVWREEALTVVPESKLAGVWLVFKDQIGLGDLLVERLEGQNLSVIQVSLGKKFAKLGDHQYQISWNEPIDYQLLIEEITKSKDQIAGVINLVNCQQRSCGYRWNDRESLEEELGIGYYHLLYLTQALVKNYKNLKLYQITTNAHKIDESDGLIQPAKRMIWTLSKVINQEIDHYQSMCVDFDLASSSLPEVVDQILHELHLQEPQCLEVGYRQHRRFVQHFTPVEVKESVNLIGKEDGVYLVTGGTGGVGLELAKAIALTRKVHLILLNRSSLTEKNPVDLDYKLKTIDQIQENGTTVEVMYGDVADPLQMKEVIGKIKETYGRIDGVIHAAGVSGGRPFIPAITSKSCNSVFEPKVMGTLILAELLHDQFLDFFVTCSSLSSIVGGIGFGVYGTANSFLDSFCGMQRQLGKKFIAINWGNWGEVGIGATMEKDVAYTSGLSSLKNVEGMGAFVAILEHNWHNCTVSHIPKKVAQLYESFSFFKVAGVTPRLEPTLVIDRKSIQENLFVMLSELYVGEELDLEDRVLDLNLDSIDVMQFVTKVKKFYNVNIPLKSLFEEITVGELFLEIERLILGEQGETSLIEKQPDEPYYPVSTSQNRLFLISKLDEESTAYNLNVFWYLEGEVDPDRISIVVKELIKRHESLRTSFDLVDGKVIQRIHQNLDFKLERYQASEEELESVTRRFIRPFDLNQAPLIRIGLVEVGEGYLLMMDLHHIIFDGVSQTILFEEFLLLYRGELLPEPYLQYRDFAVWQDEFLRSEQMEPKKAYWKEIFAKEIPKLNLPTDYPRPKILDFNGQKYRFTVNHILKLELEKLTKSQGVTMFMLLLGAFNLLLGKYANQEDLIIGSPIAGRHHPDLENIIGMFVNTIPLRNYPVKSLTFSEFMQSLKENTLRAYDSQDYPLEMIVDDLKLVHDPGRNPLFDVEFNLNTQRREYYEANIDGLFFKAYGQPESTARFDLSLTGVELAGQIEMVFEYRTALFKEETIQQMAQDYLKVLEIVTTQPDIKIHEIKLVEEIDQIQPGDFADVGFDF